MVENEIFEIEFLYGEVIYNDMINIKIIELFNWVRENNRERIWVKII